MSTLAPASKPHAASSPLQPPSPQDQPTPSTLITSQALEVLLLSGPNLDRQPKHPERATPFPSNDAAASKKKRDPIKTHLSESLTGIQDYLSEVGTHAAQLNDIATLVRKVNEPLQFSLPDEVGRRRDAPDSVQQPNVYRYLSINESTLESPSEIRGFTSGRDKLDVSGIGKQLNQKLQWVNQLSGASGEMQLRYSPNQDASVLIISGNKDEPAFVAKVFGKLKETDVVT